MIKLSKLGVCALVVLVVTLGSVAFAQDDAKIFEGTLLGVDPNTHVLTLKAGDTEMQFTYNEQTELVGPEKDGQPVAVKQGSKLKVHYKQSDKLNIAMKIEVTEP
jgi:hypothetical protein